MDCEYLLLQEVSIANYFLNDGVDCKYPLLQEASKANYFLNDGVDCKYPLRFLFDED